MEAEIRPAEVPAICPNHQQVGHHLDHLIDAGDGSEVLEAWVCYGDDKVHVFRAFPGEITGR
jgi:hypothetical protein